MSSLLAEATPPIQLLQVESPLSPVDGHHAEISDPGRQGSLHAALSAMQAELHALRTQLRAHVKPRQVLSLREAARLLGIDRNRTLKALLASGQVRTVEVNGRTKVPLLEVERLAAQGFNIKRAHKVRRLPKLKAPGMGIRSIEI